MSNKPTKKGDQGKAHENRGKKSLPYAIRSREIRKSFLLLCEGVVTEPLYFKAIAGPNTETEALGFGSSRTALVKKARKFCNDKSIDKGNVEVWIVFDFDVDRQIKNQKDDFNNAIEEAESQGFKVAYSNDCFELWLVLHIKHLEAQLTREEYYAMLAKHLEIDYLKTGKSGEAWLKYLPELKSHPKMDKQAAMKNAEKLFTSQLHKTHADQNPVTTIYHLANRLDPESYPMP